ncbi:helix-turn-helix domain-containing protein [Vreelandella venusta]|uniref:helix-turn-helix domain-containing protein n=1 Tax=Vreelandella venusta TaxID=44935 RepID=UPI00197AE9A5|nr:helix-turn-helix domain-containing protein [Halomonas venusta]
MASSYESIAQGLQEAIDLNQGRNVAAKTHRPELVDVAALRKKLSMTQMEFAARFCISVATLSHWERGDG